MNFFYNQNKLQLSAWIVWGLAAAFFFCEYLARLAPSVMVPELMRDFAVDACGLGSLSAFFYYSYLAMQIPVGMLVDRFGSHRLLTIMSVLCGLSCFMFACAHTLYFAAMSRLVLGFASAFAFVGALKLASVWFPSRQFGLLAGLTQAIGMFGATFADAPNAMLIGLIGWRETLILIGIVFIFLACLIGLFVRDVPQNQDKIYEKSPNDLPLWQSLFIVLKNPQTWFNALYAAMIYGPTAVFGELWGVTFISQVHFISVTLAAGAVGAIFIGWGFGGPLFGWLSDTIQKRKPLMFISAFLGMILLGIVIYGAHLSIIELYVLMFCYGLSNAGVSVSYAVSSEINHRNVSGTSMAFCNMASVIVGAVFQPIIGRFLDLHWDHKMISGVKIYSPALFQSAMSIVLVFFIIGLISLLFIRETNCISQA